MKDSDAILAEEDLIDRQVRWAGFLEVQALAKAGGSVSDAITAFSAQHNLDWTQELQNADNNTDFALKALCLIVAKREIAE